MNTKRIFEMALFLLIGLSSAVAQEKPKVAGPSSLAVEPTQTAEPDMKLPAREDGLRFANLMLMIQNRRSEKEKLEAQARTAELEAQALEQKLDPLVKEIAAANKIDLTKYEPQFDAQKGLVFKGKEEKKEARKP